MRKLILVALLLLMFAGGCWYAYRRFAMAPEQAYGLELRHSEFQVRSYGATVYAQTRKSGTLREALRSGFIELARYIFAKDDAHGKIEMTAPVLAQKQGSEWAVRFVLPNRFATQDPPKPVSSNVHIFHDEKRLVAVLRLSGWATVKECDDGEARLTALCQQNGYVVEKRAWFARYNPPWLPRFMRRNEVMIEVKKK